MDQFEFALETQRAAGFERALLGTILAYPDLFHKCEDLLPSDFVDPGHQTIFEHALALYKADQLSARAVVEHMRVRDELNTPEMGGNGEQHISEILTYASAPSIEDFVKNVMDAATKRQILGAAALMAADANRMDIEAEEILDETEERILSLRRRKSVEGTTSGSLMDMFQTQMNARLDGSYVPALYPKIQALQDVLSAFEDQDFPIIAARPGDGKSSYMRWEAYREALSGRRTFIVNMENAETEYARWLVAMHTQIDAEKLRSPRSLSPDQLQQVKDAIGEIRALPLRIITLGSPTVREVMRVMLPEVREGAKSGWVDYVQKIQNGNPNQVQDISLSSGMLRGFSLKHHIVLGCGAQLSRGIVNRGENAEPELSDLRDSGALEQDATHVIFPRSVWARPTAEDLRAFPENAGGKVRALPMQFFVKKNRNGPVGISRHVKWSRHINHYQTIADEAAN